MERRAVYWKIGNNNAVRKGNWKLNVIKGGKPLLFDLEKDKGEQKDVARRRPAVVKKLLAGYRKWEKEVTKLYQSAK